ncbi:hypothetical protein [Shewanella sp. KT0246]|uniref:hypothetical protein n=1 Tax=Shewanella sp. KT0246 TaxID=2815912 RepID=UPI001BC67835|nr:hypothetical protein [Shewanella sp. KT0246]GIU52791.1 hypothetical protein TUM4249_24650 [Shewanella sp. KT0246]
MKKSIIAVMMMSVSIGAFAESEVESKQQLDSAMEQLVSVESQTDIFITVDEEASFESITYQGFITEKYSEIYVSSHDAKENGLEKVKKFYIYNEKDIDELSHKIAARVDQDNPTAFSVDLYRDYQNDSGKFTYIARVTEYK